jgi:hypothetical protein
MECEAVRRLLEEGPLEGEALAHLERCRACQLEEAFSQRVATAVESLPRVPAPDGFLEGVMAAVRGEAEAAVPPSRAPTLLLRPWELGWIAAACLVLLGLLSRLLPSWPPVSGASLPTVAVSDWMVRMQSAMGDGAAMFERLWREGLGRYLSPAAWDSVMLAWLCGAAAFALAFCLLLSWSRGSVGWGTMEDVHA